MVTLPPSRVASPDGIRRRVDDTIEAVLDRRQVALLTAPAGSGKSMCLTLLAQRHAGPVVWSRGAVGARTLHAMLAEAFDVDETLDAGDLVDAIAAEAVRRGADVPLVLVDDGDQYLGAASETLLRQLLAAAPGRFGLVVAVRASTGLDVSRLAVAGDVFVVTGDDLRFRAWEIDELFRVRYRMPLTPAEVTRLEQATDGWAAALHLFHLATVGKPPRVRADLLRNLGQHFRLARDYLSRHVLAELPEEVRTFLIETSVLDVLTAPLCDALRDRGDSQVMLEELVERQIFTGHDEFADRFWYHDLLRTYLDGELVAAIGEERAGALRMRAGELHERAGMLPEALRCYSRAGDADGVYRVVSGQGAQLAEEPGTWLRLLPESLADRDPWVLLARARASVLDASFDAADGLYQRAGAAFGAGAIVEICRAERRLVRPWVEPPYGPATDWSALLRRGVTHDPAGVGAEPSAPAEPLARLVAAMGWLLDGRISRARAVAEQVHRDPSAGEIVWVGASVVVALCDALAGEPIAAAELDDAAVACAKTGLGAVGRVVAAAQALTGEALVGFGLEVDAGPDPWGSAAAGLLRAIAVLSTDDDAAVAEVMPRMAELRDHLDGLDAPVLAAWAGALHAVAATRMGRPDAADLAQNALTASVSASVSGPAALARFVLSDATTPERAVADVGDAELDPAMAALVARVLPCRASTVPPGRREVAGVDVRCFGTFGIAVDGVEVDLGGLRPRARAVLRYLAAQAPDAVHREVLVEALWPDARRPEDGIRSLQTAVSSIRNLLAAQLGVEQVVARDGQAYRFGVPADACDLTRFRHAADAGLAALAAGDPDAGTLLAHALTMVGSGQLLAEDGPADWAVDVRGETARRIVALATPLCEARLRDGAARAALDACEIGLAASPYDESLWELAADAAGLIGPSAAAQVAARYARMLDELGLA